MRGFFVTGTDTGVGKTEVAAYLARHFSKKGLKVGVMKPVATGVRRVCKDAEVLKIASNSKDSISYINPISFKLPLAPLTASRLENIRVNERIIWDRFKKIKASNDIIIVEGIGGVMVPIHKKGRKTFYVLDMISKMKLPAIIVSRPGLGTINHTLMSIEMLRSKKIKIAGIIFNYTTRIKKGMSIKTNFAILEELSGVKGLGIMNYTKDRKIRRVKWLRKIES